MDTRHYGGAVQSAANVRRSVGDTAVVEVKLQLYPPQSARDIGDGCRRGLKYPRGGWRLRASNVIALLYKYCSLADSTVK